MKTYFACSDIHGFYKEWMKSLKESGFDVSNQEHVLIILGDIFDRGNEPWKIYKFIKSLPEERVILIKGNHEYLLLELVKRKYPFEHDIHNGTYLTLTCLYKDPYAAKYEWIEKNINKFEPGSYELYSRSKLVFKKACEKLFDNKKLSEIVKWLNSSRWRNYYELGKYIFVHSFIPLQLPDNDGVGHYYPNWRETATDKMWYEATWGCPYKIYLAGCFKEEERKGKILVCGHWHTSDFYNKLLYPTERDKWLSDSNNPIFKNELFPGLIGIDACTVLSKRVNILVISESDI